MMMLESNDKKQLQIQEGFLSDLSPRSESMTLGGHCEFIEHNSTATINCMTFNVISTECTYYTSDRI